MTSSVTTGLGDTLSALNDFGNASCVGYDLCMKACPVVDPAITVADLNAAADDPAHMSAAVRQFALDCVQCGRCTSACPTAAPRDHMMLYLREHMPDRPAAYKKYGRIRGTGMNLACEMMISAFNLASKKKADRRVQAAIDDLSPEPCDTLFYFGCYAFSGTQSPTVTLDLADKMGQDYGILAGLRTCCGWPQYLSGDTERADYLLGVLEKSVRSASPKVVVSGCAECVAAVQVLARRSGGAFESISTVEWLQRNRDKLDLTPQQRAITFHDSCHMTRKMNKGHISRELMDDVFDLKEMRECGTDGLCCGYYGFHQNPAKEEAIRRERLEQARDTGTGVMAVECVTCMEAYRELADEYEVEVVELQKLVWDAVEGGAQ